MVGCVVVAMGCIAGEIVADSYDYGLFAGDARLGTQSRDADGFVSMMRVAFTDDEAAAAEYYNKSAYVTVLRTTPPQVAQPEPVPFARPELRVRGDDLEATPSMSHAELNAALTQQLYSGVMSTYGKENAHHMSYTLKSPTFSNGYDCLSKGIICNGDSMDTTYPNSRVEVLRGELCVKLLNSSCPVARRPSLGTDDFYIVTGVNHNATGKSLYSSVVMYDFARLESVGQFDSSSKFSSYAVQQAQQRSTCKMNRLQLQPPTSTQSSLLEPVPKTTNFVSR